MPAPPDSVVVPITLPGRVRDHDGVLHVVARRRARSTGATASPSASWRSSRRCVVNDRVVGALDGRARRVVRPEVRREHGLSRRTPLTAASAVRLDDASSPRCELRRGRPPRPDRRSRSRPARTAQLRAAARRSTGVAVAWRAVRTWSGVSFGLAWSSTAAAPATCGRGHARPEAVVFSPGGHGPTTVPAVSQVEEMSTPGAVTSGWYTPIRSPVNVGVAAARRSWPAASCRRRGRSTRSRRGAWSRVPAATEITHGASRERVEAHLGSSCRCCRPRRRRSRRGRRRPWSRPRPGRAGRTGGTSCPTSC